jgi:radical SAM superfamily enzyme YgiQ (UPF0313 family)
MNRFFPKPARFQPDPLLETRPVAPPAFRIAPPLDPDLPAPPPTMNEILLVNPFYPKDPHASFGKHVLTPTLALAALAGATPAPWRVRYWDENLLHGPPPVAPFPEIVGITVHLTFARRAYALADWFRSRGARVVMGGLHVQSCPDEVAPHADAIVLGDGVTVWPEVLADLRHGRLKPRYHGAFHRPYREASPPDRAVFDRRAYLTTTSIVASRGCHNRCDFCTLSTDGLVMPYQTLDIRQVIEQIEADDQPYFVFIDNNLGSRPEYLRAICRALAPLRRIWSAAVSIEVTDDPTLVAAMAEAGCTGVFVGFESLSAANIDAAGKRSPRPDDYARRIRVFHDGGIQVNGSFVLGFDHDGPECFDELFDWVESVRLECATYHILTPYPGTPLFRRMEEEGRILHRDWELYDTAHAVFRPRRMTPERLEAGYDRIYRRTFALASIWRRRPEALGAALPYLAQSLLYKKSNLIWEFLIRRRLVTAAWRPLVELNRWRKMGAPFPGRREIRSTGSMSAFDVISSASR